MSRKLTLIVLAGVLALSTTGVLAGTREKKNDRRRDGRGENCTLLRSQARRGGGGGDRKRDGSGKNCTLSGTQKCRGGGNGDRRRDGSGNANCKRDGSGNGNCKRDGRGNGGRKRDGSCVVRP